MKRINAPWSTITQPPAMCAIMKSYMFENLEYYNMSITVTVVRRYTPTAFPVFDNKLVPPPRTCPL